MAVVALEGTFRSRLVQPHRVENELYLLYGGRHGEVVDTAERKFGLGVRAFVITCSRGIEQHLVVTLQIYEVGVASCDYGRDAVAVGRSFNLDIELLRNALLERYGDTLFVDVAFAALDGIGIGVFQHLETVFGASDDGTQSDGYRQTDHAGAGYSHTHRILEDIGAQTHVDMLWQDAEHLAGACRAQRYGHRFGTPYGGDDLSFYERYDSFSFGRSEHGDNMNW